MGANRKYYLWLLQKDKDPASWVGATYRVLGPDPLSAILDAHEPVFWKELGRFKVETVKVQVDP